MTFIDLGVIGSEPPPRVPERPPLPRLLRQGSPWRRRFLAVVLVLGVLLATGATESVPKRQFREIPMPDVAQAHRAVVSFHGDELYVITRERSGQAISRYDLGEDRGRLRWRAPLPELPGQPQNGDARDASLVHLHDGVLIVSVMLAVYSSAPSAEPGQEYLTLALDQADGRELWRADGEMSNLWAPLLSTGETLALVDPRTGNRIWERKVTDAYQPLVNRDGKPASPVLLHRYTVSAEAGTVQVWDPAADQVLATRVLPPEVDLENNHGMAAAGLLLFIANRTIVAYDASTLEPRWTSTVRSGAPSAWPCGELICTTTRDGIGSRGLVAALDPATGRQLWERRDDRVVLNDALWMAPARRFRDNGAPSPVLYDTRTGRMLGPLGEWEFPAASSLTLPGWAIGEAGLVSVMMPAPASPRDLWVGRLNTRTGTIRAIGRTGLPLDTPCVEGGKYLACAEFGEKLHVWRYQ
ncbi:PQQ-binding-like beta-propeller repeat protein [Longispora albida]|uniref:outer membrane protein assembly factor BamB family protein n=1 Tax=Longispora albida TaxID=203523 RepID=UPI00036804ED|nr:PQQ-binding-like beta-propeller repeat protein [Longispora albida]